ncbi:MAG: hypothetical protein COW19_07215 [Zetaproteobacteria bacterium CG12_big_fil_rev_8_21_14_0_65_55_1124]|nr:MAG: hypothetical protein AUJ58_06360 [Zetaproteobacteria bacterium CG1_02_55_237]PIS20396.1 MAG: hypothetical protein COT53_00595 [Zetaproteobacteria bacterium CG08_land_8_20_14_0_20_55_17]PIW42592.1 MAG: hypothetical protein COW19_07215 [Zetaproteobacteria bacterium CG12_big_fil_rev_8_21_14_0_65_55_1124]PIY54197.1 MAG: hypothetical protein COZ01_01045 [Zetaproteobacteria bacterium CG_4_10_14_0_8_um_filter_55_43]PIZ38373.1 MAG: hypothetical protein COY36_06480 [Zetaproteobacteria bacterium 
MIASNVMTTNLLSLHADALVKDAVALFRESAVHEFPVVDSMGKLVGEVSSRSVLHYAVPAYASSELLAAMRSGPDIKSLYANLEAELEQPLSKVMSLDVQSVTEKTPTSAVAAMIITATGDSSHVYVIDDDGQLLGAISARDIIRRLPEHSGA